MVPLVPLVLAPAGASPPHPSRLRLSPSPIRVRRVKRKRRRLRRICLRGLCARTGSRQTGGNTLSIILRVVSTRVWCRAGVPSRLRLHRVAWHLRPRASRPIPLMAGRREFGPDDEKNFSHVTLCLRFIYRDFSSSGRPVARISRPRGGRSVSVPGGPDQAPHHLNSLEVAWTKVMMGCVGAGIVEAPQFSMA